MYKVKVLSQYERMRKDIADSKDEYLEQIFKYIKAYFKQPKEIWDKEIFITNLENIIYKSLTETYSITTKAVKEIYNIEFSDRIDNDTLKDLTYSADGKTLNERLGIHYDNAVDRGNPTLYFYNRMVVIMDTETLYSSNHVIHGKLKRRATHAEVVNVDGDVCWEHEECEYWLEKGKIPIEELKEIPPYHPVCECEVIYYLEDEEE